MAGEIHIPYHNIYVKANTMMKHKQTMAGYEAFKLETALFKPPDEVGPHGPAQLGGGP